MFENRYRMKPDFVCRNTRQIY